MRRIRNAANIQPRSSDVCVLVAPPLGRARVWASFHLPAAWLRAVGWECDFLAQQKGPRSDYERQIGMRSRAAYQRLARSGARVIRNVRRLDIAQALLDPTFKAFVLIAHHVEDKGKKRDDIELQDGLMPARELIALLDERNARGPFAFVWMVCRSDEFGKTLILTAPNVLPFSAPIPIVLPAAIETSAALVESLDGATPFDVAQQWAFARRFPAADHPEEQP
jgi:hypothetical protein